MRNLQHSPSPYIQSLRLNLLRNARLLVVAVFVMGACVEVPVEEEGEVSQAGIMNGIMNGFMPPEGLTQYLANECPLLQQRLLSTGNLTQAFPSAFSTEISKTSCEKFMFYTVQLMVPLGEQIKLYVGTKQVASFTGVMGMQHLVRQVYPQYTFVQHAFLPAYPVARKVVTQGYAALTNGIARKVSYRTNIAAMDAHRQAVEDTWPRELLQIVPFSSAGLAAMASNSTFLARQPDFFNPCDISKINYEHLKGSGTLPSPGSCSLPVVVHGNLSFTDDVVPGRSCRILEQGEIPPPGATVVGDVIVPDGGCPLIYYAGRNKDAIVYDDRTKNVPTLQPSEGCDVAGPSSLTNCRFKVAPSGTPAIAEQYLSYWVFNVEPVQ
ncbi:MAG TPA: hypothetical protein VNO30_05740 [Kofleriaceae bacterium]|nr:hypothetical protein [Kofleriaceae bacterium]